ncbi:MAG: efflux RND transporter periplasmic adaptor subunit [Proteobacteria bacterium]|nr:efflux RND transporter periplasmic adaptor subunit [Pseudomonadota bacterium]
MTDTQDVRATLGVDAPKRGRWIGLAVLVVILVGAGALWMSQGRAGSGRYVYTTAPVELGSLEVKVTAVGSLEPSNAVAVSSELSGIVARVYVDENDEVTEGQLLAELDTELLQAQARQSRATVRASEASVAQALATVEGAASTLKRSESLWDSGGVSDAEVERSRTAHRQAVAGYALAEAQLQQARASSQAAQTNLDKAKVISPITGVVLERTVEEGQAVVSSLQAATLFRLAEDLRKMTVDVEVDEADVGRIEAGQPADFTVAAYPDRVFDAEVTKVNLAPKGNSEVVTYVATLSLDNPDMKLLPGMTATASITAEVVENALLVPNAALRFSPPDQDLAPPDPVEGRRRVRLWTLDGDPIPVVVFPGASDGRRTVIEGELYEGQELVLSAEKARRGEAKP